MKMINKVISIIDDINEWTGRAAAFLGIILMGVVVFEVIMRYVFNRPHIWAMEMCGFMLLGITFFGGGYVLLHNGHVKVDILYMKFPPRVRALIDLIIYPVLLFICIVLVWYGGEATYDSLIHGYRTHSIWAPIIWPSQIIVPIGGILIGLQFFAKWLRDFIIVIGGVGLEDKLSSKTSMN